MELPCKKCGKPTHYDGVAIFGAKTICKHCGCKKPHTMRAHPVFPFLVILVGFLLLMLINPFDLSQDAMGFCFAASFILFLVQGFLALASSVMEVQEIEIKDEQEFKIPRGLSCFSFGLLFFGFFAC